MNLTDEEIIEIYHRSEWIRTLMALEKLKMMGAEQ